MILSTPSSFFIVWLIMNHGQIASFSPSRSYSLVCALHHFLKIEFNSNVRLDQQYEKIILWIILIEGGR